MILDALLTQCLREPEERQRMRRDVKFIQSNFNDFLEDR
jgi:hypothetical protein